jgi:exonuclease VII small subunit
VGLEESLVKHERGTFLIQHCRAILSRAEKQIELLTRSTDGQGIDSAPLDDQSSEAADES